MSLAALAPFIEKIDHVGIAVADFDQAVEFYSRALGLAPAHEEINEEQGVREAMLDVGGTGSCIQLLAPIRTDSPIGKFLDRSGPGVHHVAYTVTDIAAASTRLREAGVRLLYDEPRSGTGGSKVNFTHPRDSGGVLVELVEPNPG